jgi:hypothetical protein
MRGAATKAIVPVMVIAHAACSLALSSPRVEDPVLACTASRVVPTVDLVGGLAAGVAGLMVLPKNDCVGCGYFFSLAITPSAVYFGSAASGFRKVGACRRERDRRARAAATLAAEERAERAELRPRRFFCTVAEDGTDVGVCSRTDAACREHQADLLARGVLVAHCEPAASALCFTAVRVVDGARTELCFPSGAVCEVQRKIKRRRPAYDDVSECTRR